jgi:hypothetical protein
MHVHIKKATAVSVLILSVLWLHGCISLHGFDSGAVDQESQKCSRYTIETIDEGSRDFMLFFDLVCVHEKHASYYHLTCALVICLSQ